VGKLHGWQREHFGKRLDSLPQKPQVRYNRNMNAICFIIDRLHAGYLGCYGNTWIETPSFDRLASHAVVFDRAVVDSPWLERLYRSYWLGWHALCPAISEPRPTLAALLGQAGIATTLLTDEPQVARHPSAGDFGTLIEIEPPSHVQTAEDIGQTHFARCFVEIIHWLESAREPFLLWCHLGGLGTTWDAPLEFRQKYWEEGDPPVPETADVPERVLPERFDPDELLGITQSYAGQVSLLDACIGAMLEFFESHDDGRLARETLLSFTSARGFPLGEHRRVGPCDDALFGELVQVPWMMQAPGNVSPARNQCLIEPADLWATLLDYWKVETTSFSPTSCSLLPVLQGEDIMPRDRLCVAGNGSERAIRTPAWHLRVANPVEAEVSAQSQLFAKPDDRWEVNDVASRCPEAVEGLQATLAQYELSLPGSRVADFLPLSDALRYGIE